MEIVEFKGPVDFGEIIELLKEEWPSRWTLPSDEELVAEMRKSADPAFDVVKFLVEEGRTIGFSRWSPWPREAANREEAHTFDIAVAKNRRGMGFGRLLMEDMIEEARRKGYSRLRSRTFEDNAASIALHFAAGFGEAFRVPPSAQRPNEGLSIVWELWLKP